MDICNDVVSEFKNFHFSKIVFLEESFKLLGIRKTAKLNTKVTVSRE